MFAGDILDNSDGFVGDLAYLYRFSIDSWTLTPGVGVSWSSKDQNSYYYGVSRGESARSGLAEYNPSDSWSPYLELSANYNINQIGMLSLLAVISVWLMKLKTAQWWINHTLACCGQALPIHSANQR